MAWFEHPTEPGGGRAAAAEAEAHGMVLAHVRLQVRRPAAQGMGWEADQAALANLCSLNRGSERPHGLLLTSPSWGETSRMSWSEVS